MSTPEGVAALAERHHKDVRLSEPITLGNPPVATGVTHEIPGSCVQRIVSVSFTLTTDANAANRIPFVRIFALTGTGDVNVAAPFTRTANGFASYTFAVGLQQFGANNAAFIGAGLPDLRLPVGMAVSVDVTNMQAGDQLENVLFFVDQWPVRD